MEAKVKRIYPESGHGFLFNPEGGPDIFFRAACRYKQRKGRLKLVEGEEAKVLPKKGKKVVILNQENTEKGPRATKWKLP